MSLMDVLRADLAHYLGGSFGSRGEDAMRVTPARLLKALLDIDFRVVLMLRLSMALWSAGWRKMSLLLFYRLKSRRMIDIHPSVQIGPGLRMVHAFCIVIGAGTRIGSNVVIFGQALMGKSRPDLPGERMPVIGDYVLLGAGCRVLGAVQIPSWQLVPANAVVTTNKLKRKPDLLVAVHDRPSVETDR
jgi:serine O-acetyltransferase